MKLLLVFILTLFLSLSSRAQKHVNIIDNSNFLNLITELNDYLYNWNFNKWQKGYSQIKKQIPDNHPAKPFMEAVFLYWYQYPFDFSGPKYKKYIQLLDLSIIKSDAFLKINADDIEGIFFKTFALALQAISYASEGESFKAINRAKKLYALLDKIKKHTDQNIDFYFILGCYNFYVEAYPETHPIYRTLTFFLAEGDKQKGIKQLKKSCEEGIFSKTESFNYLISIFLNYYRNYSEAAKYAKILHKSYPNNLYFTFEHALVMLLSKDYKACETSFNILQNNRIDKLYRLAGHVIEGLYFYFKNNNINLAYKKMNYVNTLIQKDDNSRMNLIKTHVYWIFSRYYELKNQQNLSKEWLSKAKKFDIDNFIETFNRELKK